MSDLDAIICSAGRHIDVMPACIAILKESRYILPKVLQRTKGYITLKIKVTSDRT